MGSLLSLVLFLHFSGSPAKTYDGGQASDPRHRAMYLYNLVRYVDWQSEETVIGIIGESDIVPDLLKLAKNNKKVRIKQLDSSDGVNDCNVVFLPSATNAQFYQTQKQIGKNPIFLIVDRKQLVIRGAEMGFYLENEDLKFGVNNQAIEETGIKISQTLLTKVSAF